MLHSRNTSLSICFTKVDGEQERDGERRRTLSRARVAFLSRAYSLRSSSLALFNLVLDHVIVSDQLLTDHLS